MAEDMREVMRKLGYETFAVAGHDRGRVAHHMARDYPDTITHVALLDIVPTLAMYERLQKICNLLLSLVFLFSPAISRL